MEEHQPIGIEYSMTQHYMEFYEDHWDKSRYLDHTFPQAEFDKYNKKHEANLDKKRREKPSMRMIWWLYIWGEEESQLKSPYQAAITW